MAELVLVREALPKAIIQFQYATANNITHRPLYEPGTEMLIASHMVPALQRVIRWLGNLHMQLVIFYAHRDEAVQQALRKACPDDQYVLEHSGHVADTAVDVSLADRRGNLLDMGTMFDAMDELSHRDTTGLTADQQRHRAWLDMPMERAGFKGWPYEWWHFDYTH